MKLRQSRSGTIAKRFALRQHLPDISNRSQRPETDIPNDFRRLWNPASRDDGGDRCGQRSTTGNPAQLLSRQRAS
jgi:hypothetical protein